MRIKHVEYNLSSEPIEPVVHFLARPLLLHEQVGGLLDYGYGIMEIASMLHISSGVVGRIMVERGYKTIDQLQVEYE